MMIDYIFNRSTFGREHVALLATFTAPFSAMQPSVSWEKPLPKAEIDSFLKWKCKRDHISNLVLQHAQRIIDPPSHLSIHGGRTYFRKPMTYYTVFR